MTEVRWIVVKQIACSVTRRTMLVWASGIVGSCMWGSGLEAGQRGGGTFKVTLREREFLVTLKRVGERWMAHLFPGTGTVEAPSIPAALRAMADQIEVRDVRASGRSEESNTGVR